MLENNALICTIHSIIVLKIACNRRVFNTKYIIFCFIVRFGQHNSGSSKRNVSTSNQLPFILASFMGRCGHLVGYFSQCRHFGHRVRSVDWRYSMPDESAHSFHKTVHLQISNFTRHRTLLGRQQI